jgi:biopolymer transport protein ExbD
MADEQEQEEQTAEIQMGPMIDCVFLLLLYFISAAQIRPEEKYLSLMMPGQASRKVSDNLPVELRVAISDSGEVFCNDQLAGHPGDQELPIVRAKLKQAIDLEGAKQPVVIHPQPKVRQQRIVDVLNACAGAGVQNLSFFANE